MTSIAVEWARSTGERIKQEMQQSDPAHMLYLPAGILAAVLLTADEETCEVILATAKALRKYSK